jgi:predicted NBD/HSP70 family sugar kinase
MTKPLIAHPKIKPALDDAFQPSVLSNHAFQKAAEQVGTRMVIGLERNNNAFSKYETKVFPKGHPDFELNYEYIERIVKFLLWQRGGYKVFAGGPHEIGEHIREQYSSNGKHRFDIHFMGEQVYERPFEVIPCSPDEVPAGRETGMLLGRNLDGYRIGFDLGASDRKACAVVDGKVIYSEEVIWEPRLHSDPDYHYREIMAALKTAGSKMARVDAIGGSSAGIYIDNRPMVASLFRGIPKDKFGEIKDLFTRIQVEMNVPLEVINDGDVTALAGSMSIEDNAILGIALGSSEAAGYINSEGHIMGWLNELAFAPIDSNPSAAVEEWSGEAGCGASYLSQQCVFRLAPIAGINIPASLPDAEKLKFVQDELEAGNEGALKIWQSMGVYLGYGLAHYADFYDIRHVLILGRCTSGRGGNLLLSGTKEVLQAEFPELLKKISLHLPDEEVRRVGQSVAAASLPTIMHKEPV